ncbi:hypothetical protein EVJ58_g11078 [Rhodofomes roseus]|uniref:Zinc knuckle domain-containing protein n=1 Tax=Rhodofomes roseus TaxID=34475 RepID=A0A4Y9XK69_9APHY|nr:hypothetical protein EVJ58_g11078 [Rhodofomes roseus]
MDGAASATRPLARRKIICWTCGGEGHTSRDKACPDYGKPPSKNPQMHAGRIVDEDAKSVASSSTTTASKGQGHVGHTAAHLDQVDDEGQDSYPRSDYGGLQYASDGDQADSPFEEHSDDEGLDVRLGSMRFGAMRVERRSSKDRQENLGHGSHKAATDDLVRACAMQVMPPARSMKAAWLYDPKVRRTSDPRDQPKRSLESQRPLCAEVDVNGVKAYTLFDTGCTTDTISPELAYLAKADRVDLKEQINLQLGTKGSRTTINYGALPHIHVGPVNNVNYMDVVDIDRYDMVLV